MNLGNGHAALEALIDCKQTLVILRQNFFSQLFHTHRRQFLHVQAVLGDLRAADCLHERLLKVAADRHNLAGCLHLGTQLPASVNEFIKWPFREFNRYIVKGRLEACHRLAGYLVRDLVQMITDRNLGCHAGNRISGCFRSKGGRTGYTRVYLDNGIFKALRIQRKLAVAAALDAHRLDNIQRCVTAGAITMESPVWTPTGSKFSIEQTVISLPMASRITSNSISFHPEIHFSTRI